MYIQLKVLFLDSHIEMHMCGQKNAAHDQQVTRSRTCVFNIESFQHCLLYVRKQEKDTKVPNEKAIYPPTSVIIALFISLCS